VPRAHFALRQAYGGIFGLVGMFFPPKTIVRRYFQRVNPNTLMELQNDPKFYTAKSRQPQIIE